MPVIRMNHLLTMVVITLAACLASANEVRVFSEKTQEKEAAIDNAKWDRYLRTTTKGVQDTANKEGTALNDEERGITSKLKTLLGKGSPKLGDAQAKDLASNLKGALRENPSIISKTQTRGADLNSAQAKGIKAYFQKHPNSVETLKGLGITVTVFTVLLLLFGSVSN